MVAPETSIGANNTGMILGFLFFLVCLFVDKCYLGFIRSKGKLFCTFFACDKEALMENYMRLNNCIMCWDVMFY